MLMGEFTDETGTSGQMKSHELRLRARVEMTETENGVIQAGRFVHEKVKMDVSKRRLRNLEPARPLRRLNVNQVMQSNPEIKPPEKRVDKTENCIKVEQLYEILQLQRISTQPIKKERICYSRDFLIKLAGCPMAMKKPEFLPEHPIVLENGRTHDVLRLFARNCNRQEDMVA